MPEYVRHNKEHERIRQEIIGADALRRVAAQEEDFRHRHSRAEHERERHVLFSTLPRSVAKRILAGERVLDHVDVVSVLYMDIVGFTTLSAHVSADAVVAILDSVFNTCDELCVRHGLTKIQTVGDAYLAVAGLPEPVPDHAQRVAHCALDVRSAIEQFDVRALHTDLKTQPRRPFHIRIGLDTGSATAGVLGLERLQYDVWGEAIKNAAHMESTSKPGMIQATRSFVANVKVDASVASFIPRGSHDHEAPEQESSFWVERRVST